MGIAEFLDAPDSALLVAINGEVTLVMTKHETATRLIVDSFPLGPVVNVNAVNALLGLDRPSGREPAIAAPLVTTPALPGPKTQHELICPDCGKTFTRNDVLARHRKGHGLLSGVQITAPTDDNFICPECTQVFATKAALGSHRFNIHGIAHSETGVPCTLCPRIFKNQHALDEHLARGHQVNGTWSTRPKATDTASDPAPTSAHDDQAPITDTAGAYVCPECGKHCATKRSLGYHRSTMHAVKPERQPGGPGDFACSDCPKTFATNHALSMHRFRVHDIHRPPRREPVTGDHVCTECEARFETPASLEMHRMKAHRIQPDPAVIVKAPEPPESVPVTPTATEEPTPQSLDITSVLESPVTSEPVSKDRKVKGTPVADGACPVCHEPLVTHERCDGCGVLIGPEHETTHSTFITGANYCRDCAHGRVLARKAHVAVSSS